MSDQISNAIAGLESAVGVSSSTSTTTSTSSGSLLNSIFGTPTANVSATISSGTETFIAVVVGAILIALIYIFKGKK